MSAMTNDELIRLGRVSAAMQQALGFYGNADLLTLLTDALEADEAKLAHISGAITRSGQLFDGEESKVIIGAIDTILRGL